LRIEVTIPISRKPTEGHPAGRPLNLELILKPRDGIGHGRSRSSRHRKWVVIWIWSCWRVALFLQRIPLWSVVSAAWRWLSRVRRLTVSGFLISFLLHGWDELLNELDADQAAEVTEATGGDESVSHFARLHLFLFIVGEFEWQVAG
jgi:hypothetical protein